MDRETNIGQTTYNAAKRDILDIINTMGEVTSMQISMVTGQTREAASMCLFRYHGQGLLRRHTLIGRTKVYALTERGRERLAWLVRSERFSESAGIG